MLARTDDPELGILCGEEGFGHLLEDAHRAVALDVGMASHRAQSGPDLADHAAQQQHIGALGDRRDRVTVLGESHRPAQHDALRGPYGVGEVDDLGSRQSRDGGDLVDVDVVEQGEVVLGAGARPGEELVVEDGAGVRLLGVA